MKRKIDESENDVVKKIPKDDSIEDIVKSIQERLNEEENEISALKEFLKRSKNRETGDAFSKVYLAHSPDVKEAFHLFSSTGKPTHEKLELIWQMFDTLLNAATNDDTSNQVGSFIASKLIQNHSKLFYTSLSKNASNKLLQSVLKCMTMIIAQGANVIKEFSTAFDFSSNGLKIAATKRDSKCKPDPRTCFIRFTLAFFVFGDKSTANTMLVEKGLASLVFDGVHLDSNEVKTVVLETMLEKIVKDSSILKKTKLQFFNSYILSKISFLLDNKVEEIKLLAMNFLMTLCTSYEFGICFHDSNQYFTGKLLNPIILKFLQLVKHQIIQSLGHRQLAIAIFKACPDVIVPFFNSLQLQLDPQQSEKFSKNTFFMKNIFNELVPVLDMLSDKTPKDILLKLMIPVPKQQLCLGLKASKEESFDLLTVILQQCKRALNVSKMQESSLVHSLMSNLPDVSLIVTARQNILANPKSSESSKMENGLKKEPGKANDSSDIDTKRSMLKLCTECLYLYQCISPGSITESGFNICKLLMKHDFIDAGLMFTHLSILLDEPNQHVTSWLEKKISGSQSVLHLLVNILAMFKNDDDVIDVCIKLYVKAMNPMHLLDIYESTIFAALKKVIQIIRNGSTDDKQLEILNEFATTCYMMLKNPFEYLSANVEDLNTNPFVISILRNMKSVTSVNLFVVPFLRLVLTSQIHPQPFMKMIDNEIKDNPTYSDYNNFMIEWVSSVHNMSRKKLNRSDLKTMLGGNHPEDKLILMFLPFSNSNSAKIKSLEHISVNLNILKEYFMGEVNKSSEMFIFLMHLVGLSYSLFKHFDNIEKLCDIVKVLQDTLTQYISKSESLITYLFQFDFLSDILNSQNKLWNDFLIHITQHALQHLCIHESSSWNMFFKNTIDRLLETTQHGIIIDYLLSISSGLDKESRIYLLSKLSILVSNNHQNADLKNFIAKISTLLKNISLDINVVCENFDYGKFISESIETNNKDVTSICHIIFNAIPSNDDFDVLINLPYKDFRDLLEKGSEHYNELATLILRRSEKILNEFIEELRCGNNSSQPSEIAPFVPVILLYASGESRDLIGETLKDIFMNSIEECSNWPLQLILPFTNNEELERIKAHVKKSLNIERCVSLLEYILSEDTNLDDINSHVIDCMCLFIVAINKNKLKSKRYKNIIELLYKGLKYCLQSNIQIEDAHCKLIASELKNFSKSILMKAFTLPESHLVIREMVSLLEKTNLIIENLYKDIFIMMKSHSKFLDVLFEENQDLQLKGALCEVLLKLSLNEKSCCNSSFLQILLVSYQATLSRADRAIFKLIKLHESHGYFFQPTFGWGKLAFEKFNSDSKEMNENLTDNRQELSLSECFQTKKILKTTFEMPISLNKEIKDGDLFYDPLFVLEVLHSKLQAGCILDVRNFISDGFLSLIVSCLSHHDIHLRQISYTLLALFNEHLENSRFKEKNQISYLLILIKNSVSEEFARWPSLWTIFIIRYLHVVLKPEHAMYNTLNRLILQKPVMSMREFPIFLPLFNSNSLQHGTERSWLMKLLLNGIRDANDYYMYKRLHVFELIMAYYNSTQADRSLKDLILQVISNACKIPVAAYDLIKTHALLSWLHSCISCLDWNQSSAFIGMLSRLKKSFSNDEGDDRKSAIPRMFVYELDLLCTKVFLHFGELSSQSQIEVSDIYIWLSTLSGYYGDIKTSKQSKIIFKIISRLYELYISKESEKFHSFSQVFTSALKFYVSSFKDFQINFDWTRIYRKAIERDDKVLLFSLFSYKFLYGIENRNIKMKLNQSMCL